MNYYIQGDANRAKEIETTFEKLGYKTSHIDHWDKDTLFFTADGHIKACVYNGYFTHIVKTHPDYKELELPKPHYNISNFKPFDKVLVRDGDMEYWNADLFSSYYDEFHCFRGSWEQCIPFEDNEVLLGTTDMPSEEFINW